MWNDKPDGYPIPARNPTGTGMNFYLWVRVQISTRSLFAGGRVITLLDPLPSLTEVWPARAREHLPEWRNTCVLDHLVGSGIYGFLQFSFTMCPIGTKTSSHKKGLKPSRFSFINMYDPQANQNHSTTPRSHPGFFFASFARKLYTIPPTTGRVGL
jgi:hypothetical protein